ncbi:MAG: Stp1/IreP family PP2C-type Ser/Thr phosphatase [Ruthenibacterium sp.]
MKIVAKTDIGHQRSENQDNYRAGLQADGTVWALVCDGMGGAQGGRMASTLAAEYMERAFSEEIDSLHTSEEIRKFLFHLADTANSLIFNRSETDASVQGMGTTLVCAVVRGGRVQYVHAGDSRAYVYTGAGLSQLTKDHSMVQELIEQGTITQQEAYYHPNKNLITRALGVTSNVDVDYGEAPFRIGDILLLCTDGLTNYVTDEGIAHILSKTVFEKTADALVSQALVGEGLDNITVLLASAQPTEDSMHG